MRAGCLSLAAEERFLCRVLIRQVLGAVSQFEKAMLISKLKGARDRKREASVKVEGRKSYAELDAAKWCAPRFAETSFKADMIRRRVMMTTETAASGGVGLGRGGRMSRKRKRDAVLRLLRGEDLETLSRARGATAATLTGWRDTFVAAGEASLATRSTDGEALEIRAAESQTGRDAAGAPLGVALQDERAFLGSKQDQNLLRHGCPDQSAPLQRHVNVPRSPSRTRRSGPRPSRSAGRRRSCPRACARARPQPGRRTPDRLLPRSPP